MFVKKRRDLILNAQQCLDAGDMINDRGILQPYIKGDWILTTEDGRRWPVSNIYFKEVYEEVKE